MKNTFKSLRINADLLKELMKKSSEFGATGDGGVHRPVLTDAHKAARDWFCKQLRDRGYQVLIDDIGNVFGLIDLAGPEAPLVMVGSHLDSQPNGGRFDGAYGVIAALCAVESLRENALKVGAKLRCNYVVVDWMNEEGARFQPSLLGSSVYAGTVDRTFALSRTDMTGKSVKTELERTDYMGSDPSPEPVCFIELHIEGDDKMEKSGAKIAPFIRHWGASKVRIEVTGEQNHTGPTPMEDRRDAVLGAAYIIAKVKDLAGQATDTLYTSVARLDVSPNSPNIVPGKAVLFAELRAPEADTLEWAEAELRSALPALADRASVNAEIVSVERRPAGKFDARLIALCKRAADDLGLASMELDTIAGHDGVAVNAVVPSIVVAVPSVNGVIHRHDEFTSDEDLIAGANVLLQMIARLDTSNGSLDDAGEST